MATYTGIAVDHRVEVGELVGALTRGDSTTLVFTNSAAPGGHSIVTIPTKRLELSLGRDLARLLISTLPITVGLQGEHIPAKDLLYTEVEGRRFRFLFVDADDETVEVSVSVEEAERALGERLGAFLAARGRLMKSMLMQQINEAF